MATQKKIRIKIEYAFEQATKIRKLPEDYNDYNPGQTGY
jgi:hypothetical protein